MNKTQDLTVELPDGSLNVRVAVWIEHEKQLLVARYPNGVVSLPGGRVKHMETSEEAIKREVFEEIGQELSEVRFVSAIENFFVNQETNKKCHELLFLFTGKVTIEPVYFGSDNTSQSIEWLPKSEIGLIRPGVLIELLQQPISHAATHLINWEL